MANEKQKAATFGQAGGPKRSTQAKTLYAICSLAADQCYRLYGKPVETRGSKKPAPLIAEVRIAGKANVVDKTHMITPAGRVTPISEEEAEVLSQIPVAKKHMENGYLDILTKKPGDQSEVDKAAKEGLSDGDPSAPITDKKIKTLGGDDIEISTGKDVPDAE